MQWNVLLHVPEQVPDRRGTLHDVTTPPSSSVGWKAFIVAGRWKSKGVSEGMGRRSEEGVARRTVYGLASDCSTARTS